MHSTHNTDVYIFTFQQLLAPFKTFPGLFKCLCSKKEIRTQSKRIYPLSLQNTPTFCHSLNSTSNEVESDKVISLTTTPPQSNFKSLQDNKPIFGMQPYFDPTRKMTSKKNGRLPPNRVRKMLNSSLQPNLILGTFLTDNVEKVAVFHKILPYIW
jgi:hypothetical protein